MLENVKSALAHTVVDTLVKEGFSSLVNRDKKLKEKVVMAFSERLAASGIELIDLEFSDNGTWKAIVFSQDKRGQLVKTTYGMSDVELAVELGLLPKSSLSVKPKVSSATVRLTKGSKNVEG